MFKNIALLVAFALLCFSVKASETHCTFSLSDRALDVKIEFAANSLEKTSFTVSDWAGVANYADNLYRIAARDKNGKALRVEKSGARSWTVANARKAFDLSYTVIAQKASFMGDNVRNHFHPTIFKDYAFLWGTTFLLFPDDKEIAQTPVRLEIVPNEYGAAFTNFPGKAASFDDLSELFIAAGAYRVREKTIGGRRVKFLLEGANWKFTDEEFAGAVSRIIEAQIKYMGFSPSKDDLLITLTEGTPASKGGTVVRNVISVYPNPQAGLHDFDTLQLISHEHFHFFNGNYWRDAGDKREGYYKWMSEGFTEYYSGLTLYRENLITEKEYVAWLNKLLLDYQTNPQATSATAEILAEKYWASQDFNRLPYVKGALVGFLTDLRIRQNGAGKQIDDLMRLLINKTDKQKGYTDALLIDGFAALAPAGDREFYNDFMLGAKSLPIAEIAKASSIAVSETQRDVFDLGFTTEGGKLEGGARVKEVTTAAARAAGLKPGDALRGFSFKYNQPQEEATITVERGGETLRLRYYPKKPINVLQIEENAQIQR